MDTQNLLKSLHLSLLNVDECLVRNWNFQKVTSPFTRLYLVKSGEGNIIHNHKKYELKPGRLYLIPSFTLCNYLSKTFLGHFYIHFIPQITGGTDLFKQLNFKYELEATETDFLLMKRIVELNPERKLMNLDPGKYCKDDLMPHELTIASTQQIADCMETQGILLQLFSKFLKIEDQTVTRLNANSKISQTIEYIQINLSETFTLAELAGICHLSNDYFSRLFLKTMGMRPIDYINRKRIEDAQMQLVVTNTPIEKIAIEVGIDNLSYFNRLFKKYSCVPPGEYRRLHRLV
ncbi:MAG: AraC family transcriptional regulator [Prolixibacteraceae bacterium]|jgi:AraC-like DNA-binding protein|nr:AraC family transcriptional regulator [Prolixibacteraceae bacterium]